MNEPIKALSKELAQISSLGQFWARILKELANYGVTSICYSAIATHAEAAKGSQANSMITKSNHTQKYFDSFGLDQIVANCKIQEGVRESANPVIWHQERLFNARPAQRPGNVVVRKSGAGDMGLHIGFTLPTTFFSINHFGAIGVSMAKLSLREFEEKWPLQQDEIIQILGILNARMRDQYLATIIGLAPREKEVLIWLALGERPAQIADRLGIGTSSVDKYISNARTKLKANTRDQAVANAVIFKAIKP